MIAALGCLASAVLLLPPPAARRRYARVLQTARRGRIVAPRVLGRVLCGLALAGSAVWGLGPLLAAVLVVATASMRVRRAAGDRRCAADRAALAEGLETVIGELRVGAHPSAAAATAVADTSGVAARAFAVCAARSRLGGSAAEGLRVPDAAISGELSRIADAWHVAEHHGLALADLVATARADLTSRMRFRDRTVAALAGARATAAVLAGLPLLGLALGQLLGAAPLHVLFGHGIGAMVLPLGTGLLCAGLLWTDAITRKVLT